MVRKVFEKRSHLLIGIQNDPADRADCHADATAASVR